jgi:hypothetical protein
MGFTGKITVDVSTLKIKVLNRLVGPLRLSDYIGLVF